MYGKRAQVLCSNDVTMSESMHPDDGFMGMNRKRHCTIRSPFEATATSRHEDKGTDLQKSENVLSEHEKDYSGSKAKLRHLSSQWSEKIIENMKSVHSTKDLKAMLSDQLHEFYMTVCSETLESKHTHSEPRGETLEDMTGKINQLTHRNSVLCGVLRHQYETIRRLQASEAMNVQLIKEKAALSEQLSTLQQCVNAYIASVDESIAPTCGPFEPHFEKRPPDVF